MKIGYFLSSEEFGPQELVRQAQLAERAGFESLWLSDHYHPWNHEQGHSPFVWSTIGALSQATERMRVTTAVTCPTLRIHPAVIAQAAATSAVLLDGRFQLGVGTGEALNEHIFGDAWPDADTRIDMLEEAVEILRLLWQGGSQSFAGDHYLVQNAEIFDLPEHPPEILVSGFGPKATDLAARIGDGYCTVGPDADLIRRYRDGGGTGPVQAGAKVCWGPDEEQARQTAHRLWPNESLPGELAQILPTPEHFEQAAELIDEELVAESVPCGPDIDRHLQAFQEYADAGVDELFVQQIGDDQEGFFEVYAREVLPHFDQTVAGSAA